MLSEGDAALADGLIESVAAFEIEVDQGLSDEPPNMPGRRDALKRPQFPGGIGKAAPRASGHDVWGRPPVHSADVAERGARHPAPNARKISAVPWEFEKIA